MNLLTATAAYSVGSPVRSIHAHTAKQGGILHKVPVSLPHKYVLNILDDSLPYGFS